MNDFELRNSDFKNRGQKDFSETQTEAQPLRSRAEGRERVEENLFVCDLQFSFVIQSK